MHFIFQFWNTATNILRCVHAHRMIKIMKSVIYPSYNRVYNSYNVSTESIMLSYLTVKSYDTEYNSYNRASDGREKSHK